MEALSYLLGLTFTTNLGGRTFRLREVRILAQGHLASARAAAGLRPSDFTNDAPSKSHICEWKFNIRTGLTLVWLGQCPKASLEIKDCRWVWHADPAMHIMWVVSCHQNRAWGLVGAGLRLLWARLVRALTYACGWLRSGVWAWGQQKLCLRLVAGPPDWMRLLHWPRWYSSLKLRKCRWDECQLCSGSLIVSFKP